MPILFPTERGTTPLAQSRTKDALRMLEKKMAADNVARATKVYTSGPENWDHIIPTSFPKYAIPQAGIERVPLGLLDRVGEIKRISPELAETPVVFNDPEFNNPDADGRYHPLDNIIGIPGPGVQRYVLNHEGTHAGYLRPTGYESQDRYLKENLRQKETKMPYDYTKEEIRARMAENLPDDLEETIAALNKMYRVRADRKGNVVSSNFPPTTWDAEMRLLK